MDSFIKPAFAQDPVKIGEQFDLAYEDLGSLVNKLVPILFSIAAMMVVFYFIIGAFELITSQGDKAHIVSARSKIYHSIIGFILLIVLFLAIEYIMPALGVTNFMLFRQ